MKKTLGIILAFCVVAVLLFSVIRSGFLYTFDNDEIAHVQVVYLINSGQQPFRSFFTVYSPAFHALLVPLLNVFGETFTFVYSARILMIILFLIRIALVSGIAVTVFSPLTAFLFIVLFLLDPITVFAGMQIRPDNVMLVLFTAGVLALARWKKTKKPFLLPLSGFLLGLALVLSLKAILGIGVIVLGSLVYSFYRRKYFTLQQYIRFLLCIFIPVILFCLWYALQGLFFPMVQQLVIDAVATNAAILYPPPMGNFYWPNNVPVFGLPGRPITWIYVWLLPALALAGSHAALINRKRTFVTVLLVGCLIAYWLSLFFIRAVFIQYYLLVTWLFALFAAVYIEDVLFWLRFFPRIAMIARIVMLGVCMALIVVSVRANINRSTINADGFITFFKERWKVIPDGAKTFPNFLFRLSSFPLTYGYYLFDIPAPILSRYGTIAGSLKENRVDFVLFTPEEVNRLAVSDSAYIQTNYRYDGALQLWIRK